MGVLVREDRQNPQTLETKSNFWCQASFERCDAKPAFLLHLFRSCQITDGVSFDARKRGVGKITLLYKLKTVKRIETIHTRRFFWPLTRRIAEARSYTSF